MNSNEWIALNELSLLNTNKIRAILQRHVLEFQQADFPELNSCLKN